MPAGDWLSLGSLLGHVGLGASYDLVLTAETIYSPSGALKLLECIKQVGAGAWRAREVSGVVLAGASRTGRRAIRGAAVWDGGRQAGRPHVGAPLPLTARTPTPIPLLRARPQVLRPPHGVALVAAKSHYFGVGGGTAAFAAAAAADGTLIAERAWVREDGASNKREILRLAFPDAIAPYFQ